MERTITIVWRAFNRDGDPAPASKTVTVDTDLNDHALCERAFADTNRYEGSLWDALQPLPEDRSHTALSVVFDQGDYVIIDGTTYEVATFGFTKVEEQA